MAEMYRTFEVLLQPTVQQSSSLTHLLTSQREVYNAALEERIGAWKWNGRSVSLYDQQGQLTAWDHSTIQQYGVSVCRGTLRRINRAFDGFFRRVKRGDTPGFPRFKGDNRFDSFEYPDAGGWGINEDSGRLRLRGVGHIKYRGSKRGLPGTPKTLTVRRCGHRWRAFIQCKVEEPEPRPRTNQTVGIDLGIDHLITTSDGEQVDNLKPFKGAKEKLAQAQQDLSRKKRGSNRRKRAVHRVANHHRKIRNQRKNHLHHVSKDLVDNYDLIAHEKLNISGMSRRPKPRQDPDGTFVPNGASAKSGLNRSINDAGWGTLLQFIRYKAEEAGVETVEVDPRHTSQTCHECGHVDKGNRMRSVFRCLGCGHEDHADINAACNIHRAGLALRSPEAVS